MVSPWLQSHVMPITFLLNVTSQVHTTNRSEATPRWGTEAQRGSDPLKVTQQGYRDQDLAACDSEGWAALLLSPSDRRGN